MEATETNKSASDHLNPGDAYLMEQAAKIDAKRASETTASTTSTEGNESETTNDSESTTTTNETDTSNTSEETTTTETSEFNEAEVAEKLGIKDPEKTEVAPSQQNEEFETFKSKAQQLDKILSNKEIKALWDAAENGESPFEVLRKLQGEDYSKLSTTELSDEDKEIEKEKFNGMLISQQKEVVSKIRQGLDTKRSTSLEQHNSTNVERQAIIQANAQKAMQRVNELKELKVYNNLELTPERWSKIQERLDILQPNENNEYDVDRAFRHIVLDLFEKDVIMANVRKATVQGKVEILKSVTRPDAEVVTPTTMAAIVNDSDEKEKASAKWREDQASQYEVSFKK